MYILRTDNKKVLKNVHNVMHVTNASLLTKTTSHVIAHLNFERHAEDRLSYFTRRANLNFSYI